MKLFFAITGIFLSQLIQGQIRPGTYKVLSDTNDIFGFNKYSELHIKPDNSFIFKSRGNSCLLWYDIEGKWEVKNNNLILTDNGMSMVWPVDFRYEDAPGKYVQLTVQNKNKLPLENVKVKYIFWNSKDTITTYTNCAGQILIDTKNIADHEQSGKFRHLDDIEIFVEWYSAKNKELMTGNNFNFLSKKIVCTIDEDLKSGKVTRTTTYAINNSFLHFSKQEYNKAEVYLARYLYGDFKLMSE